MNEKPDENLQEILDNFIELKDRIENLLIKVNRHSEKSNYYEDLKLSYEMNYGLYLINFFFYKVMERTEFFRNFDKRDAPLNRNQRNEK